MEIRKTQATGPAAAPAPASVPTGASSAPSAAPRAQADSTFSGSSAPASDTLGTARSSGPHVALPSMASFVPPARIAGPLDPNCGAARSAVETSMNYLNVRLGETLQGDAHDAFSVRSVERDSLGMTHVRLDRMHDGLKVYPEQVIAHLDADGNVKSLTGEVQPIPRTLAAEGGPQLSDEDAKAKALKAFGNPTDRDPSVEKVITQAADGSYRVAYHVETTNLGLASGPQRQNYLIDAQTGEVLKNWNQMGGIDLQQIEAAKARQAQGAPAQQAKGLDGEEPPPPPVLKTAEGSATPAGKINDNSTVTSSITIDGDDFKVGEAQLDLDIDHTYRGDLVVKLTSPSGKEYVVSNREGGSDDNIKGSFDLSDAFEDEPVKGEWKLSVEDKAAQDVGVLNSWKLHFKERDPNQKPPEPPAKDDTSIYAGTVGIGATQKPDGT